MSFIKLTMIEKNNDIIHRYVLKSNIDGFSSAQFAQPSEDSHHIICTQIDWHHSVGNRTAFKWGHREMKGGIEVEKKLQDWLFSETAKPLQITIFEDKDEYLWFKEVNEIN